MLNVLLAKKEKEFFCVFLDSCTTRVPQEYHACTRCKRKRNKKVRHRCVPKEYRMRTGTRYVTGTGTLPKMDYPCFNNCCALYI
jgi:hypothetical protein